MNSYTRTSIEVGDWVQLTMRKLQKASKMVPCRTKIDE